MKWYEIVLFLLGLICGMGQGYSFMVGVLVGILFIVLFWFACLCVEEMK